ncbi:MAG: DUF84 family protein [Planctomycetes bacterium]|nr:DUF84 family protein [Planctomycetota bacterium]
MGTGNPVKVRAVRRAVAALFPGATVKAIAAGSTVAAQPLSLAATTRGAKARATAARKAGKGDADLGVGVESGVWRAGGAAFLATLCAVTDGRRTTLGGGPFFELPSEVASLVLRGRLEVGRALARRMRIRDPARGQGAVGVLTRGVVTRFELVRMAALMALAPWRYGDAGGSGDGIRIRAAP